MLNRHIPKKLGNYGLFELRFMEENEIVGKIVSTNVRGMQLFS